MGNQEGVVLWEAPRGFSLGRRARRSAQLRFASIFSSIGLAMTYLGLIAAGSTTGRDYYMSQAPFVTLLVGSMLLLPMVVYFVLQTQAYPRVTTSGLQFANPSFFSWRTMRSLTWGDIRRLSVELRPGPPRLQELAENATEMELVIETERGEVIKRTYSAFAAVHGIDHDVLRSALERTWAAKVPPR